MLCLSEYRAKDNAKAFAVSYMLWDDFKDTLIDPHDSRNRQRWEFIRSHDVIIGGMDYTVDTW